jgi:hypothetical protein
LDKAQYKKCPRNFTGWGKLLKDSAVKFVAYLRGVSKFLFLLYTNSYIYRPFWVEFNIIYLNVALLNTFELVKYGTRKVVLFLWQ